LPVGLQFSLVKFRPCFHKTNLPLRLGASDPFDGIDAKDRNFVLLVSVKMSDVMRCSNLGKHTNDNS
jgi:hypothetical protein